MTLDPLLAPTIQIEIERRQTTVAITKISTNTVIVPSQETDTIEIAQSHANLTFVMIVILVPDRHFPNTTVPEMIPTQTANHRHHISPSVINLDPHLFIDMTLDLLIVVVQSTIAIELRPKIANLTLETTITITVTMSLCSQIFPSHLQFSLKLLMSATNAPSFKFK